MGSKWGFCVLAARGTVCELGACLSVGVFCFVFLCSPQALQRHLGFLLSQKDRWAQAQFQFGSSFTNRPRLWPSSVGATIHAADTLGPTSTTQP